MTFDEIESEMRNIEPTIQAYRDSSKEPEAREFAKAVLKIAEAVTLIRKQLRPPHNRG